MNKKKRNPQLIICETCGKPFTQRHPNAKMCSVKCVYKSPRLKREASERRTIWNERNKDLIKFRMKTNNPMTNPKIIEKVKTTKRLKGTLNVFPGERGGNGKLTIPQIVLSGTLGWKPETVVILGALWEKGFPYHYKIDIGNPKLKIGIEIDGRGHNSTKMRELDKKKEMKLAQLGWKILRFTNQEVMTNLSAVLFRILREVGATSNSMT